MKQLYRIKKGLLSSSEYTINIDFGLIFDDDGIIKGELYINDEFNLDNLFKNYYSASSLFTFECLSVDNNEIKVTEIRLSNISSHDRKLNFICGGNLERKKINEAPWRVEDPRPYIHFIELEGLSLDFSSSTKHKKIRNEQEVQYYNVDWDHTESQLKIGEKLIKQVFYKKENGPNVIVAFGEGLDKNNLFYDEYYKIKKQYVSALSLLNGAEVRIKTEYTGTFYSLEKVDSDIIYTYSERQLNNIRYSQYVPISDPSFRHKNILNGFFSKTFEGYLDWNSKIDLDSIIYYLCSSEQARSVEEKVFIQMIAFERITTKYAELLGKKEEFIPNKSDYDPIKLELLQILDKHQSLFGNAYHTVKGKISNLNQIKRLSTADKMYALIDFCKISITEEIRTLVDVVRHKTIHNGSVGNGKEIEISFYLLDELIREIILRLIEYDGPRDSVMLLSNKLSYTISETQKPSGTPI